MKKILVAEDNKYLANAYRVKLEKTGYEVALASNGEEAITILKTLTPDLIVLDLVMPGVDGFVVLEEIAKNPALADVPIIVSSNLGQKDDIEKAKALGADDYFIKSDIEPDDIVIKIKGLLQ
jgi:two-component system phosphate regulon response regulator PhoB/two-component system alkaline phosphatase synthesis response regulator PhoP